MYRVIKYVFWDIVKNKTILFYTILLFLFSFSFFSFEDNPAKAVLSLLNITLIVVPLISIVFCTIHFYNAYEFIELMLAQPVKRKHIFLSELLACACSLSAAYLLGVGLPVLFFSASVAAASLVIVGVLLTWVFVALAFLTAVSTKDKAKGIGIAILLWFYFSILYDGLILLFMMNFSNYPIENFVLGMVFLNPVDLARVFVLMQTDTAALLGYSGAVFKNFLEKDTGIFLSILIMITWTIVPLFIAQKVFGKKDI